MGRVKQLCAEKEGDEEREGVERARRCSMSRSQTGGMWRAGSLG